jgi:transposase
MERYLGADVHASSTTFSVLNPAGKQLRRDVVETNGKALVGYLNQIPGNLHLCIEEGEWSQWLVEILTDHVAEVVVFRGEWKPGPKSDAIDAHGLADRIRTGKVGRCVYKDPKRFTALRELSRTYTMITRDVVRTKNRLKSLYRSRGVPCTGDIVYRAEGRAKKARHLPVATRHAAELLGQQLDGLLEVRKEAEKRMLKESHRHRVSRFLETAPGMGPIRVAQMLPIVITPYRFRTKRQFWAYCGFGIVVRSSADWAREDGRWVRVKVNRTRGLNFNHNRMLKGIFKGAATTVIQGQGNPLRGDYDRLMENGTKPNLAKLTVARKIAAIVLAMWRKEERYKPEKYRITQAA